MVNFGKNIQDTDWLIISILYLPSFLYKGLTEATLTNVEKLFNSMSWFLTLAKWESTIFEAILIALVDIPSGPVAFFGFNELIIWLISYVLALGNVKLSLVNSHLAYLANWLVF